MAVLALEMQCKLELLVLSNQAAYDIDRRVTCGQDA